MEELKDFFNINDIEFEKDGNILEVFEKEWTKLITIFPLLRLCISECVSCVNFTNLNTLLIQRLI